MTDIAWAPPPLHGGQLRQISERYGIPVKALLDFSANINPDGAPPSVLSTIRRTLEDPETLTTYPDLEMADLKQVMAKSAGVQPENIVVANGFVPLLEAALRSLNISRCLLPVPAFSEYRKTLERTQITVAPYHLVSKQGFSYELDSILKAASDQASEAILLANPQNPSGALCDSEQMLQLVEMAAGRGLTVLLDEAFIDYCPLHSLTQHAMKHLHLIVFRSVTKFFAIPGLRAAYAVCNFSNAKNLNHFLAPWPITSFASAAVCSALEDSIYGEASRLGNNRRRSWLEQQLKDMAIETYPSAANFLLLHFSAKLDVDLLWERMIVEHQIVLRSCTNFEGLNSGHLRIAVRSEQENEKLINSFRQLI
jgi:threonine-phosphate decarboxylase